MNSRVFVNRFPVDAIAAGDRGLAYGDGVFETMRAVRGDVPWWDAHCARLQQGLARLGIATPELALDLAHAREQAIELLAGEDAVLKLIVTRGPGGRGYAPQADAEGCAPTWVRGWSSMCWTG